MEKNLEYKLEDFIPIKGFFTFGYRNKPYGNNSYSNLPKKEISKRSLFLMYQTITSTAGVMAAITSMAIVLHYMPR